MFTNVQKELTLVSSNIVGLLLQYKIRVSFKPLILLNKSLTPTTSRINLLNKN